MACTEFQTQAEHHPSLFKLIHQLLSLKTCPLFEGFGKIYLILDSWIFVKLDMYDVSCARAFSKTSNSCIHSTAKLWSIMSV